MYLRNWHLSDASYFYYSFTKRVQTTLESLLPGASSFAGFAKGGMPDLCDSLSRGLTLYPGMPSEPCSAEFRCPEILRLFVLDLSFRACMPQAGESRAFSARDDEASASAFLECGGPHRGLRRSRSWTPLCPRRVAILERLRTRFLMSEQAQPCGFDENSRITVARNEGHSCVDTALCNQCIAQPRLALFCQRLRPQLSGPLPVT